MSNLLFVSGHGKTGTSSMVGMLNSSPQCFVLYEAYLCRDGRADPRGRQFLEAFPSIETNKMGKSLSQCYRHLWLELNKQGYNYNLIGDKILADSLSECHWREMGLLPVVYMVRDLRTWLCKNIVVSDYNTRGHIADKAVAYVKSFVQTFPWRKCLRVSLENFLLDNPTCVQRVFKFIELKVSQDCRRWWKSVGCYPAGSPKAAVKWWSGHDSSQLRPAKLDTTAHLRNHKFWDDILPIFDKYYDSIDQGVSAASIQTDLNSLSRLAERFQDMVLEDLYEEAHSVSFGAGLFGALGHRSSNPHVKPFRIRRRT